MAEISYTESTEESESADSASEKILEEARARFKLAQEAERENRKKAAEDRRFRAGDQWPEEIKNQRAIDGRPCLTINKMPQFEQQVTNDQRQNRPSIKVHPVDDKADPKTAKILQGIIKNIEVTSSADTARDTAFENAVRGSYGYYRIVTEYVSPDSFNQEIRVKRIRDPDTVLLDPNHQEPDGSDAEWGFIFGRMPKDQFLAEYGESKLKDATEWELESTSNPDWVQKDTVQVAEYFYKEYEMREIALLSTGEVVLVEELEQMLAIKAAQGTPAEVVKKRKARFPSVKWCKHNGCEILEKTDWPGQWIPILPVYGAELVVDGKLTRESLIRHAKDPARMYNFWKSAETEAITLAPKSPYVMAEGQDEGYEADWKNANRRNHAVLKYKPTSLNGTPLPPPQRQVFEPAVAAITQASMLAADEVKQTIGIYDASLGARSNETSGIAIQRRNQQAQTSNFHFTDNLNRTIRHEGRIYVDLIPKIYDTARIARILGDDGEAKMVPVNQEFQDPDTGETLEHKLSVGKYDVTIDTGPSYATRRQEAASSMVDMTKAIPTIGQAAPDLIVKNMDWPGATELAERLKKTLPPNLVDDPKAKQIPPQVQAQLAQMDQMIQQLTDELGKAKDPLELKRMDIESRERIEFAKMERDYALEVAKLDQIASIEMMRANLAEIEKRQSLLRMDQPIEAQAAPEQFAPEQPVDGGMPAEFADPGAPMPTGGPSPGPSMEGTESP